MSPETAMLPALVSDYNNMYPSPASDPGTNHGAFHPNTPFVMRASSYMVDSSELVASTEPHEAENINHSINHVAAEGYIDDNDAAAETDSRCSKEVCSRASTGNDLDSPNITDVPTALAEKAQTEPSPLAPEPESFSVTNTKLSMSRANGPHEVPTTSDRVKCAIERLVG